MSAIPATAVAARKTGNACLRADASLDARHPQRTIQALSDRKV
jgi:hypothetical protein